MGTRFNTYSATTIIALSALGVNLAHRFTNGAILASSFYTCFSFFFLLILFSLKIWPWNKIRVEKKSDFGWVIISLLCLILILYFWIGRKGLGGDYRYHKMFVLQLQNGHSDSHLFYKDAPNYYPPLVHTIIAIVANILHLSVDHSYLLVSVLIYIFMPIVAYNLADELGFNRLSKFFLAGLLTIYHIPEFTFNFALNFILPTIARNVNLLIFITFLSLWFRIYQRKDLSYNLSLTLGILAGLIGFTHPTAFMLAELFLFLGLTISLYRKIPFSYSVTPLILSFITSSFYYIPLLWNILYYGGIKKIVIVKDAFLSTSAFKRAILSPMGFLSFCAIFNFKKREFWIKICLLILLILFSFILLSQFFPDFKDKFVIFRYRRFKYILFIFIALLAAKGLDNIFQLEIKHLYNLPIFLAFLIGFTILSQGFYSYLNTISASRERHNILLPEKIREMFPGGTTNVEKLRYHINNLKTVLLAPPEWTMLIARRVGMDVPYVERPRIHFKNFLKMTISQKERLENVNAFYENLDRGIFRKDILEFFGSETFLAVQNNLEENRNVVKKKSIKKNKVIWYLYEMQ